MRLHIISGLLLLAGPGSASAAVVAFDDRTAFLSALSGSIATENFEGLSSEGVNPAEFGNGRMTVVGLGDPIIIEDAAFCIEAGDTCLLATGIGGQRVISGLPAGTAAFDFDYANVLPGTPGADDTIFVTIITSLNVFNFELTADDGFFGFADTLGEIVSFSLSKMNDGYWSNYSIDNFTTADNVMTDDGVVPLPAAVPLFLAGIAGLSLFRRRRKLTRS